VANFLTVIHECKDYSSWKQGYDADASNRAEARLTELHVLREHDNPNLIAIMFGGSDVGRAQAIAKSPALAAAMKAAGIKNTNAAHSCQLRHNDNHRS